MLGANSDLNALSIQIHLQLHWFPGSSRYHRGQRRKPSPPKFLMETEKWARQSFDLTLQGPGYRNYSMIYLFLPPLSLPVLLLVWSVAVVWLFLTADSWSSALLLVCICWEVCRAKHQRFRGKNVSVMHPLFYFHKRGLFWSICSGFWPRALIRKLGKKAVHEQELIITLQEGTLLHEGN